ncbi:MAG: DUF4338 domain-containing protein [Spartobacteria bacterium]|nr:DUF4338 domain-containing protein [Spartobacteria bacterium]
MFRGLDGRHHYWGLRNTVGENMMYLVRDRYDRVLCCFLFGSAARAIKPRDQVIGWNRKERLANLQKITNNTRFLILPWVKVRHLASHVLSLIVRRIREDWRLKYGHSPSK